MCTPNDKLTLCTCGEEIDLSKPHWKLSRRNPIQSIDRWEELGSFAFDSEMEINDELVTEQINTRNCFDFEYQPQDGDVLYLQLHKSTHSLKYSKDRQQWISELYTFNNDDYLHLDEGVITTN
ncbi:hypothetical protein AB4524_10715 [Vibrio breoganii]